jgi:hypothetical protein
MADNVFSGARAKIFCNGNEVGRAQNISGSYNIVNVAIEEMGSAVPTDIVTVGSNVTFSVGKITDVASSLVELGLIPGMTTDELVQMAYLDFTIVDDQTGKVKYSITGCKPDGAQSFGGNPRSLFTENMNFVGMKIVFKKGNE